MSDTYSIYIGPPEASTPEGELLLELADELDIQLQREVVLEDQPNVELDLKTTATIDIHTE